MTIHTWATPQSSNIKELGYDDESREGTVVFQSGGIYVLDSVDLSMMEEWATSPSPGSYYYRNVKTVYRARKV